MNSKRSYLDNLNAGRQRRSDTALDDISRTLDQLEGRLERALESRESASHEEEDITRRMQRPSQIAERRSGQPAAQRAPAYGSGGTYREEGQSMAGLTGQLQALRRDMQAGAGTNLQPEFEALREELANIMSDVPRSPLNADLNAKFERLSRVVEHLASRSDDKSTKMLRLELEQVKDSLARLAREDTVQALDRRWHTQEDKTSSGGTAHAPDQAIERLGARLADIEAAIHRLPDSLSLRSLEKRLGTLTTALEQFVVRQNPDQPDLHAMIEERLDEISRAITASAARAHSPSFDTSLLERIEARIASLAGQIDELAAEQASGPIVERLNGLSDRVDEIAHRLVAPEQSMDRLAQHVSQISRQLESMPQHDTQLLRSLEDRVSHLSNAMERQQEDVLRQGHSLFEDVERRLQDILSRLDQPGGNDSDAELMAAMDDRFASLAQRIEDARNETGDSAALRAFEERLDAIAGRLQETPQERPGLDPEIIRKLESQVARLSAHLEDPAQGPAGVDHLTPRLDNIERSVSESRTAVMDATRQAVEQALANLGTEQHGVSDDGLRNELKTLEALTRRSDERNSKTFGAIHDTLLKIVDRLGSLETEESGGKIAVERTPPIDPIDDYDDTDNGRHDLPREPSEMASEAARDALDEDRSEAVRQEGKPSRLGGLSRALRGRRGATEHAETRTEPEIDEGRLNEPLEPGSGAPDLNSIMRRVHEDHDSDEGNRPEAAKADFIAAARRAAKAAAAEAEVLHNKGDEGGKKGGKLGIGKVLGRRKKTLLLALGGAVLLAGGAQITRAMLEDGSPAFLTQMTTPAEEDQASGEEVSQTTTGSVSTAAPGGKPVRTAEPAGNEPATASGGADNRLQVANGAPDSAADAMMRSRTESSAEIQPADTSAQLDIPSEIEPAALREAAASGHAEALYTIASRYAEGLGVDADVLAAARWYGQAAKRGLAPAQYRLGNLYEKGMGVEADIGEAAKWYQRAAVQGNASAMHNLGVLHAMGINGPANNEEAARWFIEAAELGVIDSQYNLGILYAKGVGVERDLSEAYKWFDIVARSGDQDAAAKRDEIAGSMEPAELAKAQGKAKLWRERKPDPAANTVDIPEAWRLDDTLTGSVDVKKAIGNIQVILNKNGYDAGTADGILGEKTRSAIRAFQEDHGMPVTGEINDTLARALLDLTEKTAQ